LNVALHGLEAALGITHDRRGYTAGKRAVVRYADDFVVFCESREDAERVKDRLLPPWLAERGLSLSGEKTRVVHLTEGFDFLGFTVRHHEAPRTSRSGYKLRIEPSEQAVAALRRELRGLWLRSKGHSVPAVLARLNPVIRGWAEYHRRVCASRVFGKLDYWMFHRAQRYAKTTHPMKPWRWLAQRYWGKLNKGQKDRWVFGDKETGRHLLKFGWFKTIHHPLVRGRASPDDPSLREYWWERRKVNATRLCPSDRKLAVAQGWLCRVCGLALLNGEELHRHHKEAKGRGGSDTYSNRELLHLYCHHQETHRQSQGRRRTDPVEEPL
jgi:RNA-directed DNA polymerase